jgi:hypothetical protein
MDTVKYLVCFDHRGRQRKTGPIDDKFTEAQARAEAEQFARECGIVWRSLRVVECVAAAVVQAEAK